MEALNAGYLAAAFLCSFALTFLLLRKLIVVLKAKGYVGVDDHKPGNVEVPEMGGIAILASLLVLGAVTAAAAPWIGVDWRKIAVFMAVVGVVGAIGLVDDLKTLGGKTKTALTTLASLPLLVPELMGVPVYTPYPELPFIGRTRLTVLYRLFLPFSIAIGSNAVNMLDVYNGVMPSTTILVVVALMVSAAVTGKWEALYLQAVLLGALVAFWWYNKYPAKVFAGDVGSLTVGAALVALAIIYGQEIVFIVAFLPFIINGFHSLLTIGGLKERREIKRPTVTYRELNSLAVNKEEGAPLVLASFFLYDGPLKERDLARCFTIVAAYAAVLAIVTSLLYVLG